MNTRIMGVTEPNDDGTSRQQILKRMRREECEYEAVYLDPSPKDTSVIRVFNRDREQIGYLSQDLENAREKPQEL